MHWIEKVTQGVTIGLIILLFLIIGLFQQSLPSNTPNFIIFMLLGLFILLGISGIIFSIISIVRKKWLAIFSLLFHLLFFGFWYISFF